MSIMLGFNTTLTLTIKDLLETTQLPERELIRQVQSLLESKLIMIGDKATTSESEPKSSTSVTYLSFWLQFEIRLTFRFIKEQLWEYQREHGAHTQHRLLEQED